MKVKINSTLLGCIIIGVSIIIAAIVIARKMPQTTFVPDTIYTTVRHETTVDNSFMADVEAARFMRMNDRLFASLLASGELDGTFAIIEENYVFSRDKLIRWLDDKIAKR